MTAEHSAAGLVGLRNAAAQNRRDDICRDFCVRHSDDVERAQRLSAHGEHIREGVGGGDFAVLKWIVDNRCEEIDGLHERATRIETENAGVIGGGGTDEHVAIARDW